LVSPISSSSSVRCSRPPFFADVSSHSKHMSMFPISCSIALIHVAFGRLHQILQTPTPRVEEVRRPQISSLPLQIDDDAIGLIATLPGGADMHTNLDFAGCEMWAFFQVLSIDNVLFIVEVRPLFEISVARRFFRSLVARMFPDRSLSQRSSPLPFPLKTPSATLNSCQGTLDRLATRLRRRKLTRFIFLHHRPSSTSSSSKTGSIWLIL
jgi:hypothetical protein